MALGFGGEVAEYYARFRRGYPPAVLDAIQDAFALDGDDVVLDLGCGTGQLAVPLAERVGSVVGMDPEADMLRLARETAAARGVRNITWVLGADTDVPAAGVLLNRRGLGATVIGQALHWMDHDELFRVLASLTRIGGGVAVVANGEPAWLHGTDWSRALRSFLEDHLGQRLTATCGTGPADRERYAGALEAAGFEGVREIAVDYRDELTFDDLVGGVYSAMPVDALPTAADRPAFATRLREALPPAPYVEDVRVSILAARLG
ncbi:methyltransferase domain-containing protein [Streptomyces sp. B6B3]|uniref:class I SAM-dependent methyltransferase n=1 Tax=Streptomyces sp. B6B3 TaxID=3153570 RepID=UPI00325D47D4